MNACLLTIFASPALEETLVDWLLEYEGVEGFSTVSCHGHGGRPTAMSMVEQVTGRQRRMQFLVQTDEATAQRMLAQMRERFAGAGLHYLITPLLGGGQI